MGGAAMAKMAATLRFIAPPQGDETCPHTPREEANPAGHPCHYVDGLVAAPRLTPCAGTRDVLVVLAVELAPSSARGGCGAAVLVDDVVE